MHIGHEIFYITYLFRMLICHLVNNRSYYLLIIASTYQPFLEHLMGSINYNQTWDGWWLVRSTHQFLIYLNRLFLLFLLKSSLLIDLKLEKFFFTRCQLTESNTNLFIFVYIINEIFWICFFKSEIQPDLVACQYFPIL